MSNGAIYRKKIRRWYSETIKWRGGHFAPSVHFAPRYPTWESNGHMIDDVTCPVVLFVTEYI